MSAILLATDLSRGAQAVEQYAYALAASWGLPVRVITVLEFPPGMDPDYAVNRLYLTKRMAEATQKLVDVKLRANQYGLSVDSRIATGIPYEEVLVQARAEETAVIVVGTRGNTGLKHILLGSTAERVIRMAPCPVLAVPVHVQEAPGTPPNPCSDRLFRLCSRRAGVRGVGRPAGTGVSHASACVGAGRLWTGFHVSACRQARADSWETDGTTVQPCFGIYIGWSLVRLHHFGWTAGRFDPRDGQIAVD
ncbi:MAG: universal stress protein [Nitrospira sp.]|nr:universal stress protein [Nitrospira sp.]